MTATATKKKSSGSKAKAQEKPLTRAQIEAIVEQGVRDHSLAAALGNVFTATGAAIERVANTAFAALENIATGVWNFLGKIYTSAVDAVKAVLAWVSDMAKTAVGQTQKALVALRELIGSMNIDWVKVHGRAVQIVATAAAIGLGITAGVVTGGVMAGLAVSIGAPVVVSQITGVLFAAITAGCVYEVAYMLNMAGIQQAQIAAAMKQFERDAASANSVRVVDAASTPATATA